MKKKEYKYYYIYKITCLCKPYVGYYYYGKHKTDKLDDGYVCSSVWLTKNYWPLYGKIENVTYKKEILFFFNNKVELDLAEYNIIGKNFITDEHCVNIQQGGAGGFGYTPWNKGMKNEYHTKSHIVSEVGCKNISNAIKKKWEDPEYAAKCKLAASQRPSNFKDKKFTDESKEKIRNSHLGKHRVYRADGTFYMSF